MPHADAAGRSLYYERAGDGPPLLLIQGLSGTHATWGEAFLTALRQSFDVVIYDHRGIGDSGPLDGSFTTADLAGDAAALLGALGIEHAHVLGVSMGGMVAQELALGHPRALRTLALGCTYAGGAGSRLTAPDVWARLMAGWSSGSREVALRTAWDVNVAADVAGDEGRYAAFRDAALSVPARVPTILEQSRAAAMHDTSARLAGIRAPTLVVHGDADLMLDVANARQIASLIPGARLQILPGAGHLFWIEQPERTAQLLREHAGVMAPA